MLKKGERTKQNILYCAEKVFSEKGYHQAQVVNISNMARVAKGTIYQYFENKESLFVSLIEKYADEWEQEIALNLDDFFGDGDPEDYARAYVRHRLGKTVAYFNKNEDRSNIVIRMSLGVNEVIEQVIRIFEEKVMHAIIGDIKIGQKFGHVSPDLNIKLAGNFILGGILRLAFFYFVMNKEDSSTHNEDSFTEQVIILAQNSVNMFQGDGH